VAAIREYIESLEQDYNNGEILVGQDTKRLGLWFESGGRLIEAHNFYVKYNMKVERKRLTKMMSMMAAQGLLSEEERKILSMTK